MNDTLQKLIKIGCKSLRKAKKWYLAYVLSQLIVLVFAIVSIFKNVNPNFSAVIAFATVILAECLRWRSDYWKSEGESAKRRWEVTDGIGTQPDSAHVADWLAARSTGFLDDVTPEEVSGSVFASKSAPSPRRLVENVQESAWWSKHQSRLVAVYLSFGLAAILVAFFVALTASIASLNAGNVLQSGALVQNIGGIICSVLMFVFSVNVVRLLVDFCTFFFAAKDVVNRCEVFLKLPQIDELSAFELMHDYQAKRSSAPMIPTFIWKFHGSHLREQWTHYRP